MVSPQESSLLLPPPPPPHGQVLLELSISTLYPFKGIYYFLTHPFLYPFLRIHIIPCFLLSIIILFFLFLFTYIPQVAFLAIIHGPGWAAFIHGAVLVLGEGAAIVGLLFEAFMVDRTLVDIFDAVCLSCTYCILTYQILNLLYM
jgi:hypothetical protein